MSNVLNSCLSKVPRSQAEAEAAVMRLKGKKWDKIKEGTLQAYLCDNCGSWHVGHASNQQFKEQSNG